MSSGSSKRKHVRRKQGGDSDEERIKRSRTSRYDAELIDENLSRKESRRQKQRDSFSPQHHARQYESKKDRTRTLRSRSRSPRHSNSPKYQKHTSHRSDYHSSRHKGRYRVHKLQKATSGVTYSQDSDTTTSSDSEDESQKAQKETDKLSQSLENLSSDGEIKGGSPSEIERQTPKQTWHDIAQSSSDSEDASEEVPKETASVPEQSSPAASDKGSVTSPPGDVEIPEVEEVLPAKEEPKEDVLPEIETPPMPMLPPYYPALMGCRSVENYEQLNRIEEGTYGVVFRARDKKTKEIVALKRLKMEKEREGFPITSLREINTLLRANHPNIVHVKEIVVGSNMDKIFIVMDYVEHDLKSLMETMKQPFLEGEVKTLLLQLLRAVFHLHDNWILHRDLKTSNLLLSHKGILKVADFGLAREYGSPLQKYTPIVVTLWYRCPELLLGAKEYSTAVDIWSVGCIFAELLQHKPLFMGKSEIDQLNQMFKELGTPNEEIWPGYNELPTAKKVEFTKQPYNLLRNRFSMITKCGFDMLNKFLTYDPSRRTSAEAALKHPYFEETPYPVDPSMFPTWPAKSEMTKKQNRHKSPSAPEGGAFLLNQKNNEEDGFHLNVAQKGKASVGPGFTLKLY